MRDDTPGRPTSESISINGTEIRCASCGRPRSRRRPPSPRTAGLACALVLIVALCVAASGLADYWRNLALNIAADLVGAAVFLYVIGPIAARAGRDDAGRADERVAPHRPPEPRRPNGG